MDKAALALFLMFSTAAAIFGQTAADLSAKYRLITSYEVQPGVVMTPQYASDGQVCEMVLERRQKTATGIILASSFSEKEVKELINQQVPEVERGRDLTQFLNTTIDGGFTITDYTYENIMVHVYGTTRPGPHRDLLVIITWRKRSCSGKGQLARSETANPNRQVPGMASNKQKK